MAKSEMTNIVTYKGQGVVLDKEPRTGVCNLCRAVMGEVNAQRDKRYQRGHHMHHDQYDDNDVLAYTMEVCPSCHRKLDNYKRGLHKEPRRKQIRITEDLYQELARLGDLTNDWQDVIAFLWKFYKEKQGKQSSS
jgi:hypothetical protein